MATLQLHIPRNSRSLGASETLHGHCVFGSLSVNLDRFLHRGDIATIWHGQTGEVLHPREVVVKMFYGEDGKRTMDHEADMYDNHLSTVQGTIVPELYGTFEAEPTPDKPNFRGCLVMEYCGTSPGQNIQSLPKAAKDELFRLASVLHDMEVHHGNLTGSSVVSRGHAFRIVGFSHASSRHKCPRPRAESPPQGSIEPALSHFSCAELFHLATSMNFWCKSFVTIYGKTFPDNALPSTEEMRKLYIECHFDGDEHEYNEFQDAQRRVAKLWAQVNMTPKVFL